MINRRYSLAALGVGVLAVILAFVKVLPGGFVGIGAGLAFIGLVLTGLSFVPRTPAAPDAEPPLSPFDRIAGLFFEPSRVFRNLREHPRWLAALLIVTLLNFAYNVAFTRRVTPERIADYTTEKIVESGFVPADKAGLMREEQLKATTDPVHVWGGAVNTFVFLFIVLAIIAGIYMLGILALGGRIDFWQALAVSTHAAVPVTLISKLLSFVLLYLKNPSDIHPILGANGLVQDNLGVLFKPSEHPVLYALGSMFGVLVFYGVWLTATGLRNAGERVSSSAAWSVSIALWVIMLVFAVASAAAFGSFMS